MFENADLIHRYTRADAIHDGGIITRGLKGTTFMFRMHSKLPPRAASDWILALPRNGSSSVFATMLDMPSRLADNARLREPT